MTEGIIEIFLSSVIGYIIGFWMGVKWKQNSIDELLLILGMDAERQDREEK